jgi:hypothetical protein
MPTEVRELLRDAAAPAGEPDITAAWRRGRRLRLRRWVAGAIAVVLVVVAVPVGVALLANRSEPGHRIEAKPSNPRWPTYRDDANGFSVQIPPGWQRSRGTLVPNLLDPREILSLGTYTLRPDGSGPACDTQLPLGTLQGLGSGGVFVWITESNPARVIGEERGVAPKPRPKHFGAQETRTLDCSSQLFTPALVANSVAFSDHGRWINAYVVFGANASQERKDQTWRMLDTLRFDPVRRYEQNRIEMQYPTSWHVADENLTPGLTDPRELVSFGTFRMQPTNHGCSFVPVNALEAVGPKDVFVSLQEARPSPVGSGPPRSYPFGPNSGIDGHRGGGTDIPGCIRNADDLFLRWISFNDRGREFYALVAIGRHASQRRQAEVWRTLNSLVVQQAPPT